VTDPKKSSSESPATSPRLAFSSPASGILGYAGAKPRRLLVDEVRKCVTGQMRIVEVSRHLTGGMRSTAIKLAVDGDSSAGSRPDGQRDQAAFSMAGPNPHSPTAAGLQPNTRRFDEAASIGMKLRGFLIFYCQPAARRPQLSCITTAMLHTLSSRLTPDSIGAQYSRRSTRRSISAMLQQT
jgi:hypothetical protein